MTDIEIEIKNYRCFSEQAPARIKIRPNESIAFIGVNNSGKSSLLKFFYDFKPIFEVISYWYYVNRGKALFSYNGERPQLDRSIFNNTNNNPIVITISGIFRIGNKFIGHFVEAELRIIIDPDGDFRSNFSIDKKAIDGSYEREKFEQLEQLVDIIYDDLANILYVGPFRNVVNLGAEENYYDIAIGEAFIRTWRDWKTGPDRRHNEIAYRVTEDVRKIFGFEQLEINASSDGKTLQLMKNRKSYVVSEVGSGFIQFFFVLANVAIKQPSYILIDEPETNLHPSLQLDFMTTLASYATRGVWFATHSVGLARSCANQIYATRLNENGDSEVREYDSTPRLSELLGELSFASYKDLGFEKILLVEGITEVTTIQQMLRLYGKDHQFVLLPMGGSQFIGRDRESQLLEIKRISNEIYALIDSERRSQDAPLANDRVAFAQICAEVGIECHVLERRAIENYFVERAIKKVKGEKYRALSAYQKLTDVNPCWAKSENWRIARAMTKEEFGETDLGEFIRAI